MPILLTDFTDAEKGGRFSLHTAWRLPDGRIAATDGHIAVIVEADVSTSGTISIDENAKRPREILNIMEGHGRIREWQPLPEYPQCEDCGGAGYTIDEGESKDCGKCDVTFGSDVVKRPLANKLVNLPDCEWATTSKDDMIPFRFTGGIGLVAPRR